jgi:hypothetical protein
MFNDKFLRSEADYKNFKPPVRSSEIGSQRDIPVRKTPQKTVNTQETLDKTFHPARDSAAASSPEEVTVHSDGEEYTLCDRSLNLELHPDAYVTERRHQPSINNIKNTKMPADTVDITLGNLGASTAQPLLPKYQNPPTFDPLTDNVLTFLTEFEKSATFNNWTSEIKMRLFGTFLRNLASSWYLNYKTNLANATKTWSDIVNDFKEAFNEDEAREQLRDQLDCRKQGDNESSLNYYNDMQSLIQLIEPAMPSGDVIRLIRRGFNSKVQKLYVTHASRRENMEEFKNLLRKFDAITTLDKPKKKESPLFTVADLNHVEEPLHRSFQRLTTRTHDARPKCFNCGRPGHMMRSCRNARAPSFRTPRPSTPSRTPELTPPRTVRFRGTTREWSRPSRSPSGDRLSQRGESSSRTPFRGRQQRGRGTGTRGRSQGTPPLN